LQFFLGSTPSTVGVNFRVFSKGSTAVELLLFDVVDDTRARRTSSRSIDTSTDLSLLAHVRPRCGPGQVYAYGVNGSNDPTRGLHFDPAKIMLHPYGRSVAVPRIRVRCSTGFATW